MAERTLPGLGLKGYWPEGTDHWGDDNDINLRLLSAVVQCSVLDVVAAEPGSPADDDMYLLSGTANVNKIAIHDNGAWVYLTPVAGWLIYDQDSAAYLSFSGSAWAPWTGGGGGSSLPIGGTTAQVLAKASGADFDVAWVDPSGGGGGGGAPWYFSPPFAADFTSNYTSAGTAISATDDSDAGLIIDASGISTNAEALVYVAPPPGVDWTVTAHIICDTMPYDYFSSGLFLYEAATHKMIQIGFGNNGGLWLDTVRSNTGGFVSRTAMVRVATMAMFFRFHYNFSTSTFTSYYSVSGKQWTLFDTFTLTSYFTAACDGVGLGATLNKAKIVCDMWEQSW